MYYGVLSRKFCRVVMTDKVYITTKCLTLNMFHKEHQSDAVDNSVALLLRIYSGAFVCIPKPIKTERGLTVTKKTRSSADAEIPCATQYHPEGGKVSASASPPYRRIVCGGSKCIGRPDGRIALPGFLSDRKILNPP